jgi:(S)-ureidoglycine aminohydrolase
MFQMRTPNQLVHSRANVGPRHALFPLEGYPLSRLPQWTSADIRILATPALGAGFAQYRIDIHPGGTAAYAADGRVETFFYVADGVVALARPNHETIISAGGYALIDPTEPFDLRADQPATIHLLRKVYEPAPKTQRFQTLIGSVDNLPAEVWMNIPQAKLQTLIPDQLHFDLAINIFEFQPGFGLPYVETHVMEHGLVMLQGKGIYYLDDTWMEVEKDDFIWMGPYCPQSFYATGPVPARYIYYKDVNREIGL